MSEFVNKLVLDLSQFTTSVKKANSELAKLKGSKVTVDADTSDVKKASDEIDGLSRTETVKLNVDTKGTEAAAAGIGKSFGGLGTILGGALGGAAIAGAGAKLFEAAKTADALGDNLQLSFAQAGLSIEQQNAQLQEADKFARQLSDTYAISARESKALLAQVVGITGQTGGAAQNMTKLAIGVEKASGGLVKAETFAKGIAKGFEDPELIDGLAKKFPQLGEVLKSNLPLTEKVAKANEALGGTFADLERQAKGPTGSLDRLQQTFDQLFQDIANPLFQGLAPVFDQIGKTIAPVLQSIIPIVGSLSSSIVGIVSAITPTIQELATSITPIINTLATTVGGLITRLLSGLAPTLKLIVGAVGQLLTAISPLIDAIGDALGPILDTLAGAVGEVLKAVAPLIVVLVQALAPILNVVARVVGAVLNVALKVLSGALGVVLNIVAGLVAGVLDFIVAAGKWVASLSFVQKAFKFVQDAVVALIGYLPDFVKEALGFTGATEEVAETSAAAADSVADLGDATGAAAAKTGKMSDEAKKAAEELKKLRGEYVKLQEEFERNEEQRSAARIGDIDQREQAIFDIKRKYERAAIQREIDSINGSGVIARQQRINLYKKLEILDQQYRSGQENLNAAATKRELERLAKIEAAQAQFAKTSLAAAIESAKQQVAAGNKQAPSLLLALEKQRIDADLADAVDAVVKATPEFDAAFKELTRRMELGDIGAAEFSASVKKLRADIETSLRSAAGDDASPFAQQVRALVNGAADAAVAASDRIQAETKKAQTAAMRSDIIRAIEDQVTALEAQRELLLKNTALTADQRKEIEQGFAKAINSVRVGPLTAMQGSLRGIADTLQTMQFDLGADEAVDDINAVLEANQKLIDSFNEGKITYQEALAGLEQVTASQGDFLATLGDAGAQALAAISTTAQTAADQTLQRITQLTADIQAVLDDPTKLGLDKAAELARINEQIVIEQGKALDQVAVAAGSAFATLVSEGASAGDALKQVVGQTVKSLLALYAPSIIALFSSVIPPPFGQIAAGAAISGLQALLSAALNGFEEGGYTGDHHHKKVVGVVHGEEFVAPRKMTRKYRNVLEALYTNKPVAAYTALDGMLKRNNIGPRESMRTEHHTAPRDRMTSGNAAQLAPLHAELRAIRAQLEAMDALQQVGADIVVQADKDSVIRKMKRDALRRTRG